MSDNQSSFASILAGVKRMRDDAGKLPENGEQVIKTAPSPASASSETSSKQTANAVDTSTRVDTNAHDSNQLASSERISVRNVSSKPVVRPTATNRITNNTSTRTSSVPTYSSIQVSPSQKGNPLFKDSQMKTCGWVFNSNILCDYYINARLQILFLSLKYHKLHPEYIWQRLKKLNGGSSSINTSTINDKVLRVILVVVDIDSPEELLRNLMDFCIIHDLSLVLSWTFEEAGNYIYYMKQHEFSATQNSATSIKGIQSDDYKTCIVNSLTSIQAVNKTDVVNLLANYKNFKNIVNQFSQDDSAANIPGLGIRKINNLKSVFSEPFIFNKNYDA